MVERVYVTGETSRQEEAKVEEERTLPLLDIVVENLDFHTTKGLSLVTRDVWGNRLRVRKSMMTRSYCVLM